MSPRSYYIVHSYLSNVILKESNALPRTRVSIRLLYKIAYPYVPPQHTHHIPFRGPQLPVEPPSHERMSCGLRYFQYEYSVVVENNGCTTTYFPVRERMFRRHDSTYFRQRDCFLCVEEVLTRGSCSQKQHASCKHYYCCCQQYLVVVYTQQADDAR